jgi:hypothetical protein
MTQPRVGHCLTMIRGSKPYIHDSVLQLLTGTCSCGQWSREVHRFDAHEHAQTIRSEHEVHAQRLLSPIASWPEDGNGLHPLLWSNWNGGDKTTGEYRRLRVPLEGGGLKPGTSYSELVLAIADELLAALGTDTVVPLERTPRLAAARALTDQLKNHWPMVQAWRVMVLQPRDPRPVTSNRNGWCYLACHTREEAEAFAPVIVAHLNRDRTREDDPYRYTAAVDLGPTELYRLQLPGVDPADKRFG